MGKMVTRLFGMVDSVSGSLHLQTATGTSQKNNSEHRDQDTMEQNDTTTEMTHGPDKPNPFMDPADMNLTAEDPHPESEAGMEKPAISDFRTAAEEFNAAFNTALYELDSSRKTLEERSARIDELNESIKTISNTLDEEVSKRRRKEEEHSRETEQLNQQIHDRESERDQLHQQVNNQKNTLDIRAEEISRLSSHIEELTNTLELRTTESQQAQEEYVCERDKLTGKINELQELLDKANTQLTIKQQDLEGRDKEIAQIREQISNLTTELESRITDNEQQKDAHIQETTSLNTRIQELHADLQARGELLDKADTELSIKQQDLENRDKQITDITGQISSLTADLESRITDNEQQQEAHIQETTSLNARIQELNADLQAKGELLKRESNELESKGKEISWLNEHVNELKDEIDAQAESMRTQAESHANTCEELNAHISGISGELTSLQTTYNELGAHAENIENLNRALHESSMSENNLHKKVLADKTSEIERLQAILEAAGESTEDLQADTAIAENLQMTLHDVESRLKETTAQNEKLCERAKVADELETEVEQLRIALLDACDADSEDSADLQTLQGQIADLEQSLEESRTETKQLRIALSASEEKCEQLQSALSGAHTNEHTESEDTSPLSGTHANERTESEDTTSLSGTHASERTESGDTTLLSGTDANERTESGDTNLLSGTDANERTESGDTTPATQDTGPVAVLADRDRFMSHLNKVLAGQEHSVEKQTVVYILLDNFIRIRDEIGILSSEQIIKDVSAIIASRCNDDDIVSRFGDCTFAILSSGHNGEDAHEKAEKIRSTVEEHIFEASGKSLITTTSIGICSTRETDTTAEEVVSRADLACEAARSSGGNQVLENSASVDEVLHGGNEQHSEMVGKTLSENRIRMYYQPISSLRETSGNHYEVLTRIVDESENIILPGEFFSMAASSGMAIDVDRYVIDSIMQMLSENPEQEMNLFIKLTRQSVADHELPIWIASRIKKYEINPEQLVFEISEDTLQGDLKNLSMLSNALDAIGCKIAIEHYKLSSQPQHLKHIHADYIKIDSSLVENISNKGEILSKVTAIMDLAKKHNYTTIAEGVESPASLAVLWELGVNFAQGYFIQEPAGDRQYDFKGNASENEPAESSKAVYTIGLT